jgi:hypothetical protein
MTYEERLNILNEHEEEAKRLGRVLKNKSLSDFEAEACALRALWFLSKYSDKFLNKKYLIREIKIELAGEVYKTGTRSKTLSVLASNQERDTGSTAGETTYQSRAISANSHVPIDEGFQFTAGQPENVRFEMLPDDLGDTPRRRIEMRLDGWDFSEIGEMEGCSRQAVESSVKYALRRHGAKKELCA